MLIIAAHFGFIFIHLSHVYMSPDSREASVDTRVPMNDFIDGYRGAPESTSDKARIAALQQASDSFEDGIRKALANAAKAEELLPNYAGQELHG